MAADPTRDDTEAPAALAETVDRRAPAESIALPVRDPDRYERIGERARGGLGRIVAARDRELDREVAIKEVLRRDDHAEQRFVREAKLTAGLQHPGIVPVHEAGCWPDGAPFYTMKWVPGRPLSEL